MVTVINRYVCAICGFEYRTEERAKECEAIPTQVPKYRVGDILLITGGEGAGCRAEVNRVFFHDPYWRQGFTHRAAYEVKLLNDWGMRMVTQGYDCE